MRHTILLIGLLIPAVAGVTGCAGGSDESEAARRASTDSGIERIVAHVNGVPVPDARLERLVDAELLRRGGGMPDAEELARIRREALQLAINGELMVQAARGAGIAVDDEEIEAQIAVSRSQFADDGAYADYLASAGSNPQALRDEAERRLLMRRYAESVTDGLVVDERRAREIYDAERDRSGGGEQVRAAQIVVPVRPDATPEERAAARRRIDEARDALAAGEAFDAVARRLSQSPLAEQGGDMGWIGRGRLLPDLERVVFATPVGETSDVFETPHGFDIVRVTDRRVAPRPSYEAVKTGLLMVLAREQKDETLRKRIAELRDEATIVIDDPALEPRKGDRTIDDRQR